MIKAINTFLKMAYILTGRDRRRWIKSVTATLKGGRLHNRLFDCMQRVDALHRIALCIGDRSSSNDIASPVGGAFERIFQPLRDQIHHHIPSWTAVVREEKRSPNHKAAKACIHTYQALRLVLKPGRMVAPSRLLAPRREGACIRKFAEPSDDLHHSACLSSVRACGGLRLRPRYCGHQHCRTAQAKSACIVHGHLHGFAKYISSCWLSFRNVPSLTKAVKQSNGHPNIVQQGEVGGVSQFCRVPSVRTFCYALTGFNLPPLLKLPTYVYSICKSETSTKPPEYHQRHEKTVASISSHLRPDAVCSEGGTAGVGGRAAKDTQARRSPTLT